MIEIESIKRLDVKPGDTLVVKVAGGLSASDIDRVNDVVRKNLPEGVDVLITAGDVEFGVIRADSAVSDD